MNKKRGKPAKRKLSKLYRKIHRTLGIWLAVFVIFLSVSGILINHSQTLKLDQKFVAVDWILDLYGINSPQQFTVFDSQIPDSPIVQMDQQVWFGDKFLFQYPSPLVSAGQYQSYLIVAGSQDLFIYTLDGELLDSFNRQNGLPGTIRFIRVDSSQLILETDQGIYVMDEQFMGFSSFAPIDDEHIASASMDSGVKVWRADSVKLTSVQKQTFTTNFKHRIMKWERVLLDMHSGRLFSKFGVWFMDLVALFFILLSITGLYLWQKDNNKKRKHR
ncbi:PepSY domain-containing protein [Thalassotalea litorea]|uniref:PepSY domain-containing protein n=1 Tax=Thalassotalea litorea TaxID=2020715 RepID=A0A5R9IKW3_9GAMM|nr:PepSY-associated TM helix domain-containing protein [Thalassotalea litorea]TLU65229.1 PepSY domain-containing protein [Thalassotalea litorea]